METTPAMMPRRELRSTEGYSLPVSLHIRIREEAVKRDWNRSDFVRKAVRYYLNALALNGDGMPGEEL